MTRNAPAKASAMINNANTVLNTSRLRGAVRAPLGSPCGTGRPLLLDRLKSNQVATAFSVSASLDHRNCNLARQAGDAGEVKDQWIRQSSEHIDRIDNRVGIRRDTSAAHNQTTLAGKEGNVGQSPLLNCSSFDVL